VTGSACLVSSAPRLLHCLMEELLRPACPIYRSLPSRARIGRGGFKLGDEGFCVDDGFTVYKANGSMTFQFCNSLLESVSVGKGCSNA
jgi:hypothetical protein